MLNKLKSWQNSLNTIAVSECRQMKLQYALQRILYSEREAVAFLVFVRSNESIEVWREREGGLHSKGSVWAVYVEDSSYDRHSELPERPCGRRPDRRNAVKRWGARLDERLRLGFWLAGQRFIILKFLVIFSPCVSPALVPICVTITFRRVCNVHFSSGA